MTPANCDRTAPPTARLRLITLPDQTSEQAGDPDQTAQDVIAGLTRQAKTLPPKYFYDQRGSELFEQICQLPEYYPTRTETAIFKQYAADIAQLTGPCELVELGSGSATKTRLLLNAYRQQRRSLRYIPVDVSGTMLESSSHQLLEEYPNQLTIHGLIGTYGPALANLPPLQLPTRMILFIGSTLGNLNPEECEEFLAQVSEALAPGQYFLLGLDLQKETGVIEAAYNDAQGVTAAFNLNMLHHLNWRFGGDFNPSNFRHVAIYNPTDHQIEMYLESQIDQTVRLEQLDLTVAFAAGERLLSEISRKFDQAVIGEQLSHHGIRLLHTFTDEQRWFGLLLGQKT